MASLLIGLTTAYVHTPQAAEPEVMQNEWAPATPEKLPRWRGFNLLEKFNSGNNKPFLEEDFRLISKLGFTFVRLPMDYRTWIKDGDWKQFNEEVLKEIDQAVEWGGQYGIHVCINFHRAPGYTVAKPPEAKSLWTDPDAQAACALHWATFARRYKAIPSERLSFNLMNEPSGVKSDVYARIAAMLIEAIRKEDPDRLIISDGLQWGQQPCLELAPLHVAQATRGYAPGSVSHYKASWVGGKNKKWATPTWPIADASGRLYGPIKKEWMAPLVVNGPFEKTTTFRLHVGIVSQGATVVVSADGVKLWEKVFACGPGEGEWSLSSYKKQWDIYQNSYDKSYAFRVPAGTKTVEIRMTEGDWLQLEELGLKAEGSAGEDKLPLTNTWGRKPDAVTYAPTSPEGPFLGVPIRGREWLKETMIKPWKEAEAMGIGVVVGEWGAYNKTPHNTVLRWAEDCLENWQEAGWGWAMWNFRGAFGILDSGRKDVEYEDWEGHKLDRKLLNLILKY